MGGRCTTFGQTIPMYDTTCTDTETRWVTKKIYVYKLERTSWYNSWLWHIMIAFYNILVLFKFILPIFMILIYNTCKIWMLIVPQFTSQPYSHFFFVLDIFRCCSSYILERWDESCQLWVCGLPSIQERSPNSKWGTQLSLLLWNTISLITFSESYTG